MNFRIFLFMSIITACVSSQANEVENSSSLIRIAISGGQLQGQLFAMFGDEKAPLVGKVALTDANGKTITTSESDESGTFTFTEVEPGNYKAVGIAGDYVGDADVEVLVVGVGTDEESEVEQEGVYTAIPLAVAPIQSPAIFETYSSLPAASFCSTPSYSFGQQVSLGGSSGCCSSFSGGGGVRGGFNFRRLALFGTAIAIPVALSGGDDDPATPDS